MLLRERIDKTIHVAQTDKRVAVKVCEISRYDCMFTTGKVYKINLLLFI